MSVILESSKHTSEISMIREIGEIIGTAEFIPHVWEFQEFMEVSDKFYDRLIDYYASHKDTIVDSILKNSGL